jgi:hypothetical protein
VIIRRCPVSLVDSIVGHGHRCKQAHDERHDWMRHLWIVREDDYFLAMVLSPLRALQLDRPQ